MHARPSVRATPASGPAKRSMRCAIARAIQAAAITNTSAAPASAGSPPPRRETASAASAHPASPDVNAITTETIPACSSESSVTAPRYSQRRSAGPASGPSVRKLLQQNATAPNRQRSIFVVRVWPNASTS